jgi:hypothetical protein
MLSTQHSAIAPTQRLTQALHLSIHWPPRGSSASHTCADCCSTESCFDCGSCLLFAQPLPHVSCYPVQLTLLVTLAGIDCESFCYAGNDLHANLGRRACGHCQGRETPAFAAARPALRQHRRQLDEISKSLGGNRAEPLCVPGLAVAPRSITARSAALGSRELQVGPNMCKQ